MTPGSSDTITFNNYFVNDYQVLGSRIVTNNGLNANNNLSFGVVVDGSVIKPNGGGTITWMSTQTREWVDGDSTLLNWTDDVWEITGNGNGTNTAAEAFTVTITTPLRVQLNCKWITKGVLNFTPQGLDTRVIDYGTGTCDGTMTVTVNGYTVTVTVP